MSLQLRWGAATDAGQVRPANEDSVLAQDGLFVVADGMGGHAGGEVASRVAVEAMRAATPTVGLIEAVRLANRAVMQRSDDEPALRGMGTTVCAITLVDDGDATRIDVVNVGDSRGYLYRDHVLEQLTEDHNLVAELEREGRLTAAEARVHPQRNIITRVLGNDPDVDVDVFPIDPFRGDRFLLCSDGLFNEVGDDAIAAVLAHEHDPQAAAEELVRLANAAGGRDNITVLVVDVVDDGDKARAASAALGARSATSTARPIPLADESAPDRSGPAAAAEPASPSRLTWRAALFAVALLLVVTAVVGSVWWVARSTYYVGLRGDRVTIFRGRPGGVLWIQPTVEQATDLRITQLAKADRAAVRDGKEEASMAGARRYVRNLGAHAEAERLANLPPTTTTTIAPAGTPSTIPPP